MRSRKYRIVTTLERGSNGLMRLALRKGFAPRAFALLETTGRRTGLARHTPVGNGLYGDTFWLVAAHGTQADYVRNLQAEPRVRVKAGGVWRAGTAVVLPTDSAIARSRTLPHQWDAAIGRMMASAPLTIRIDLDRPALAWVSYVTTIRRTSRPAAGAPCHPAFRCVPGRTGGVSPPPT
jgi:deazaflavin-dependent oxidoreductase (nitroreductase family)